jgi:hypothetical protein
LEISWLEKLDIDPWAKAADKEATGVMKEPSWLRKNASWEVRKMQIEERSL